MTSISELCKNKESLVKTASKWRRENPSHQGGIVLIWEGSVYGWKNELRNPESEQPGALAIDSDGQIYVAVGGNDYDGATSWVVASLS